MSVFDIKAAIFLAAMSYQTYPLFFEQKLTLPEGFALRYTIYAEANVERPKKEVFGFIAESKNDIVIAFRGYASYPADLVAAYDILQIPYLFVRNGGKTSRGFTCIYSSTRDRLVREVNKLPASKTLFVTGHNYGGAIATLAALDLAVNTKFGHPIAYSYGSPRVGDPDFAHRYDRRVTHTFRVVNIHDSFPTFPAKRYPPPFTEEGLSYQHVKTKHPLSFQLNDVPRNDGIACYFNKLAEMDPAFTTELCGNNPGFCPDTGTCFPFQGACKCPARCV